MRTKTWFWRLGFVVLIAPFLVLGLSNMAFAERDSIKIGMAISLSGKYDVVGIRGHQGAKMWAEWVNKEGGIYVAELKKKLPIELIAYDDKSDKDTVIKLTEKLIVEDKVDFIIGPYGSGLNLAAVAVTERYGKMISIHAGASDKIWKQGYKYAIGVLTPSSGYYKSAMEMLAKQEPKAKTLALITEDNPFNKSIREAVVKQWAPALGFKIVLDEIYPENPTDLSPILTKVKAAGADAILASSHFRDGVLLARQAAELGVYTKFFALGSAPSTVEWWKAVGPEGAQYTIATSQWEPVNAPDPKKHPNWYGPKMTADEYNEWFKKRWGAPTDFRGVQSFAAGLVIQWGIEKAGSLDVDKVRKALNDMDIMTFYGRSKIDPETGIQIGHEMVVAQWQDGKSFAVWPLEIAEKGLVYPIPKK